MLQVEASSEESAILDSCVNFFTAELEMTNSGMECDSVSAKQDSAISSSTELAWLEEGVLVNIVPLQDLGSVGGHSEGPRRRLTRDQTAYLEQHFCQRGQTVTQHQAQQLASVLHVAQTQVVTWFRNRKSRAKRESEKSSHGNAVKSPKKRSVKAVANTSQDIVQRLQSFIPAPHDATRGVRSVVPEPPKKTRKSLLRAPSAPKASPPPSQATESSATGLTESLNRLMYCGASVTFTTPPPSHTPKLQALLSLPVGVASSYWNIEHAATIWSSLEIAQQPESLDAVTGGSKVSDSSSGCGGLEEFLQTSWGVPESCVSAVVSETTPGGVVGEGYSYCCL